MVSQNNMDVTGDIISFISTLRLVDLSTSLLIDLLKSDFALITLGSVSSRKIATYAQICEKMICENIFHVGSLF